MEDVLDVYQRPYDPRRPLICLDETSRQLLGEVRAPLPAAPGRAARHDPEYVRDGVVNLFLVSEPLRGRRQVRLSARRTRLDFAACIQDLVDVHYPAAECIVLVMDHLNTHSPASLYEAFPPAEAKRLADKLEIHYTPAHGSWLNMAEIAISILTRGCLGRPCPDLDTCVPACRRLGSRAQRRTAPHHVAGHDAPGSRTLASAVRRSENQSGLSTRAIAPIH